jgi:hypothetical protein
MATVEASESGKYVKLAAERSTAMVELKEVTIWRTQDDPSGL